MKSIISNVLLLCTVCLFGQAKGIKTANFKTAEFKTIHAKDLTLKIYNADEEKNFGVASVIVSGKKEVILIDAQFSLPDAEKVAQEIKTSGKTLTTIFISCGDPDYYFGLEVFKKYFPQAIVYAMPATIEHIKTTSQAKLDFWGPQLGALGTRNIVLPQVLKENTIMLEGKRLEIIGAKEFPGKTFIWIPSIKAVAGGTSVFGNTFHLWMADSQTTASRLEWIAVLNKIESLNPEIVIPGHAKKGAEFNQVSVKYNKDYLKFYEEALKTIKTSEELIKTLKAKYPDSTFEAGLVLSAKVNTGEMKWEF